MYLKNAAYSDIVKSVVCCDCMSILKYAGTTSILSCISEKTETKKENTHLNDFRSTFFLSLIR